MKTVVFGSLNIDKVYSLEKLPEKGETLTCTQYEVHVGGKGLNQSVSLHRAGADVRMAGKVGTDGKMLTDYLDKFGVDTSLIAVSGGMTGHAVIEVDTEGKNQMILFPGANREITEDYCDRVASQLDAGDLVLMQYETSCVEYMAKICHEKGVKTALNPSPFVKELLSFPYEYIDFLILNEDEGCALSGKKDPEEICDVLLDKMKDGSVVLTLGGDGAVYADNSGKFTVPALKVKAVDTTGAGDTFTGYFLQILAETNDPATAMKAATKASSIAVQKTGAAETIPERNEVLF